MNADETSAGVYPNDAVLPEPEYETDHNVYVLGAGFSRPAGLPLMFDFLRAMRRAHRRLIADQTRASEADAIADVLRFRLRAAAASHRIPLDVENIETLFSLASVRNPSPLEDALPRAIAATLDLTPRASLERVAVGSVGQVRPEMPLPSSWVRQGALGMSSTAPLYEFYAAVLSGAFRTTRPRTTFVTFNYDTIVEDALHAIGVPTNFGFAPGTVDWSPGSNVGKVDEGVPVLKLHGSVSWGKGTGARPTIYPDYKSLRLANEQCVIIPPTWKKVFGSALGPVWERAIREIAVATRIVFVGFSFPATDLHIRYLLAAAFMENISLQEIVVIDPGCGSPAFVERIQNLFRPELPVTLVQASLEQFLGTQEGRRRIGRPPPPGYVYPSKKGPAFKEISLPTK